MTSRMDGESVSSMTKRSMPMPRPPAGGMPYSRARRKSSSRVWPASSAWARRLEGDVQRSVATVSQHLDGSLLLTVGRLLLPVIAVGNLWCA